MFIKNQTQMKKNANCYFSKDEIATITEIIKKGIKEGESNVIHYNSLKVDFDGHKSDFLDLVEHHLSNNVNSILLYGVQAHLISLRNALVRIKNGKYGQDCKTGEKIPFEQLKLCPHRTMSVETKNLNNNDKQQRRY